MKTETLFNESFNLKFNILKSTNGYFMKVNIFLFVSFLLASGLLSLDINRVYKIIIFLILILVFIYLSSSLKKYYQKRIIGQGKLDNKGLHFGENFYAFTEFDQCWINLGTLHLDKKKLYSFKNYNTLLITIILKDETFYTYHVNNHLTKDIVLSEVFSELKQHFKSSKIQFHEKEKFNFQEFERRKRKKQIQQVAQITRKKQRYRQNKK